MNNVVHVDFKKNNLTGSMCRYSSTDIDKLASAVMASIKNIYKTLKPGLPKCVYQLKLYNDLLKKGFKLQMEMSMLNRAVKYEVTRELIIVDEILVIECVVDNEIIDHHQKRVMFDLENNSYAKGLLINFSDEIQKDMITVIDRSSVFH